MSIFQVFDDVTMINVEQQVTMFTIIIVSLRKEYLLAKKISRIFAKAIEISRNEQYNLFQYCIHAKRNLDQCQYLATIEELKKPRTGNITADQLPVPTSFTSHF